VGSAVAESYDAFLAGKTRVFVGSGIDVEPSAIHEAAFPFQRDLTRWALRKGRAAIFADTGMGKTLMQLEWARLTGQRTLILAPLAVTRQTVAEGERWGIPVAYARGQEQAAAGITITNYEMLPHFDVSAFGAVVLDESSILKAFDGKTRTRLIETFADTPLRLCCTATPAPNNIAELANHAEFLGVMTRSEMLATFFVHDDQGWRLKRHATDAFYRWLASWGMSIRKPSDLGYSDEGYDLPSLSLSPLIVESDWRPSGQLFATGLQGITGRSEARRATLTSRVEATAALIRKSASPGPWLVWCGLNDEGRELGKLLPEATVLEGAASPETKADVLFRFARGEIPILISKVSISGFGMNFQVCADMAFVGLSDSYEQYYQAIRRCWRYGQTRPVTAWIVLSEPEAAIYENVRRKEGEARVMQDRLLGHVREFEKAEIGASPLSKFEYSEADEGGDHWQLMLGDSVERMAEIPDRSIDLSVFSPPFQSLYTYTATERDIGNSGDGAEFLKHFGFVVRELLRVTKPGRNCCVHAAQVPLLLAKDGVIGLKDFRGDVIRLFQGEGWVYHGEVCIDKDPQAQAIRTHSKALLFAQLRKDGSWLRPALADYVLVFRKPGENAIPVKPDLTNNEWIEWARPIWYGIREADTLNVAEARGQDDERHICPLQLGTIERCIRLWSNVGELVLDPFAGIGSTVYEAVRLGRFGVGIELKPEYFRVAVKNVRNAEQAAQDGDLFSLAGVAVEGDRHASVAGL